MKLQKRVYVIAASVTLLTSFVKLAIIFFLTLMFLGGFPGRAAGQTLTETPVPVILVHGICGEPDSFGMMPDLLAVDGLDVAELFDYSALTGGFSMITIEELAGIFSGDVRRVLRASGASQIDVVAHSMGGLIARAWMANLTTGPTIPYQSQIRKLILVGTPNYGARPALFNGLAGIVGCSETQAEQMRFGSKFVWDLHEAWQQNNPSGDILFIAGTQTDSSGRLECNGQGCDDGVVEISSAVLPDTQAERIRYVPYKHAPLRAIRPRSWPALVNVTDEQHATYRLVSTFLRDSVVLPQCCGEGTVDYNPPHLRTGERLRDQEGLLLVRLIDAESGERLTRSGSLRFEPRARERRQRNVGTITAWGVDAGVYDIAVCRVRHYGSGLLPSVEIKVVRPTIPNPVGLVRGGGIC